MIFWSYSEKDSPCNHLSQSPGAFRPRSLNAEEQESNSYRLHSQKASLQLPDFRLLLFHSVLCSLKGHLILFCFSLVPTECDL